MLAMITKTTVAFIVLGVALIGCLLMLVRTGEVEDDEYNEDEDYAKRQDRKWPK